MIQRLKNLSVIERKTFFLHFIYSIIEGIIAGALALNEFVLIKSLKGNDYQVGFLVQFGVMVLVFSMLFNEFVKRSTNKKLLLKKVALLTRLPLLLFIVFPFAPASAHSYFQYLFLIIFLVYFLANPIVIPAINVLLKNNYSHDNFGNLYGYNTIINKIVILAITFVFGFLLDYDNQAFVYVYPVLGILGIVSIIILSQIDYTPVSIPATVKSYSETIKDSVKNMLSILKQNKPFADFERGFMYYGFAWLLTSAVIAIFFEKALGLNYSSIAFYKNGYNILSIMLLPYFGKLIGKIDPRKFAAITFLSMLLFLLFMGLTEFFPYYTTLWGIKIYYFLLLSHISYGVFAATMALLWYIGSAYFCKESEVSEYQSIHLTLTGVRGLFAPLLGVWMYNLLGFAGVFGIGVLFLAYAIYLMLKSMANKKLDLIDAAVKAA